MAGNSLFVEAGSFMAYGNDERATWRRIADYVDKILRGAKPVDLPIEQPTEFRLAVNLKTAQALKDEVIR
jgi:putative ABC transport system substrate-binding protein